ncbi:hypothetical protein EKO04_006259 [Ascochyta lentis]|uniref:Uncharacterized protein n=1 Tax=Ascochyta lentis TaxID=205686 RepID=A0A8H7J405_9PLEO|nr:hypothetical protein EKO04_006259 [Ascochyta lentis]
MTTNDPLDTSSNDLNVKDLASYKITKLTGQQNFAKWERDIKVVAQYLNVWSQIDGSQMKFDRPAMLPYLQEAFEAVRRDTTSQPDLEKANTTLPPLISASEKDFFQVIMMKNAEKKYEFALDNYNKYQKKEGKALTLLRLHVSDAIRSLLSDYTDPGVAYQYLKKMYQLSDHQNLQLMHKEIESLTLKNCKDLDDFFSRLEDNVVHLRELKGSYDDNAVQAKIFRSLTPEFDETVRFMNLLYNRQGSTWPSLDDIKRQLQDAEVDIKRHKKDKGKDKADKSNNPKKDEDKGKKCPVEGCKGYNHSEDKCFVKNPDLKPEWLKLKEKERSNQQTNKSNNRPNKQASFVFNPNKDNIQQMLEQALSAKRAMTKDN